MLERILTMLDNLFSKFLTRNVRRLPMNFVKIIAYFHPDPYLRKIYYQRLGVSMGDNTLANLGLIVVRNKNKICVEIGNNVSIAPNVTFITESAANNGKQINKIPYVLEKITKTGNIVIEDDVWIGANVTVLPGIRIGQCSVIGAGSVVLKDVEPYSVYAGVPAKKIRSLLNEEGKI